MRILKENEKVTIGKLDYYVTKDIKNITLQINLNDNRRRK